MIQVGDNTRSGSRAGLDRDTQPRQLVLRVCGTSRHGEIVRLQSPKCTIGSDRRCTLRLDIPGVHPVHCLIVQGRRRAVVRRWGPDTCLNGSTFSDAELTPGDRLGIGPVEMEVLDTNVLPSPPQSPESRAIQDSPTSVNISRRLNLANHQGRRRARQLIQQLRQARDELARLRERSSEEAEHGQSALAAERERLRHEAERIEVQEATLREERLQGTRQQTEREKTIETRLAEVASREAELAARADDLNQQHRQLEAQREVLGESQQHWETREAELDEDRRQIDACRAELEVHQAEFQQKQQQWEGECRAREVKWQSQQSTLDERETVKQEELVRGWEQVESRKRELDARQTELEEHRRGLESQQTELAQMREQLEAQKTEFEQDRRQSDTRQAELEEIAERLETQHSEFEESQQQLETQQAELEKARHELETQRVELEETARQVETQRAELASQRDHAGEESQQQLETQQAELEEARHELETQRGELERTARQVEAQRAELASQRDALRRQRAKAEAQSRDQQAPATEVTDELAAQKGELQAERAVFELEKRQWQTEVQAQREQWEQQQRELEQRKERWAAKHQEIEVRLTDWQHALDVREAQLEEQRQALDSQQPTWQTKPSKTATSGQTQTHQEDAVADQSAPVDLAAVLAKVDSPSLLPEEETLSEEPSQPSTTAATPSDVQATTSEQDQTEMAKGDEDESIDEYMARLMQRLNIITETEVKDDRVVRASEPTAMGRQAYLGADHPFRRHAEDGDAPSDEASETSDLPKKVVKRRRTALESISSLAAMRELATASASSAIFTHARNQLRKTIRGKLLLAVASLALGVSVIVASLIWHFRSRSFYIGAAGLFLALLWGIQYALLSGRLIRDKKGRLTLGTLAAKEKSEDKPSGLAEDATATLPESDASEAGKQRGKENKGENKGDATLCS